MAEYCEQNSLFKEGQIEMDESYFGARRVRGKKGRGAYGKTIVFRLKAEKREGLLKMAQKRRFCLL